MWPIAQVYYKHLVTHKYEWSYCFIKFFNQLDGFDIDLNIGIMTDDRDSVDQSEI